MASTLEKKLAAMQKGFDAKKEAAKAGAGGKTYPDGRVIARLNEGEVGDTDKGFYVKWGFTILEGEFSGEPVSRYANVDPEQEDSYTYLLRDLAKFGEDIDGFQVKNLKKTVAAIVKRKPVMRLQFRNKDGFFNCYLQSEIQDYEGDDEESDDDSDDEDGIGEDDTVTYTYKGKEGTGVVTEVVDDDTVKVTPEGSKRAITLNIEKNNVEKVSEDEESEDAEIEVDSRVTGEDAKGKEFAGVVLSIKADKAKVKTDAGKTVTVDLDELALEESDEEDDAAEELAAGDSVTWEDAKGKELSGEIVSIKGDKAKVKTDAGKTVTVDLEDLTAAQEDGEEDADADEIEEGDTVTFKDGKKTLTGEVKKITGDSASVKVEGVRKAYTVDVDDLTKESEDDDDSEGEDGEDADEIEAGDTVTWKDGKKTLTGEVVKIKGESATVKPEGSKKTVTVELEDLTKESEEDDADEGDDDDGDMVEISEGMKVVFDWKGESDVTGEVLSIIDDERAKVKRSDNGKTCTVNISELAQDDEAEEEEKKPARGAKKPAAGKTTAKRGKK